MRCRGMAPAGLLRERANPVTVQGVALAGMAFIDRFDVDITRRLRTGDVITVLPEQGPSRVDSSTEARPADQ